MSSWGCKSLRRVELLHGHLHGSRYKQVYVLVLLGPAEVHKAIGGGYAVVIDHAEKVTFAMILSFRRVANICPAEALAEEGSRGCMLCSRF